MDRIPNTNSTIQSQLFEYRIIRIIRSNSVVGSIPELHFWDLSQSFTSGIYPTATVLGSIPEHQFWDRSQSVQKLSLGSDPREKFLVFWDLIPEPHYLTAGIIPRVQKTDYLFLVLWDLIQEAHFLTAGIDPRVQKRLIIFTCHKN